MLREAVFVVVGLIASGVLAALFVRVARLRAHVRRVEREGGELSRTIATLQSRTDTELSTLRGQLAAIHVNQTAEQIGARLAHKRTQPAASPPMLEEDRPTLEMVPSYPDDAPSEDDATHVAPRPTRLFKKPPIYAARPLEPLAHPDLIGHEDIADEAARSRLGPEEKTPPRRGRAAVLVPAYREPSGGGAA